MIVSGGKLTTGKKCCSDFWQAFYCAKSMKAPNADAKRHCSKRIDDLLAPIYVRPNEVNHRGRPAQMPNLRRRRKLHLAHRKIWCIPWMFSNYPDCKLHPSDFDVRSNQGDAAAGEGSSEPRALGPHPETGLEVTLKKGPYGFYVEMGQDKKTLKRASLLKGMAADEVTIDTAVGLLSLPRDVGLHPESGKMIVASTGRFGPYLLHDGKYTSLRGDDEPLTVGINRAVVFDFRRQQRWPFRCHRIAHRGQPPGRRQFHRNFLRPLWAICEARQNQCLAAARSGARSANGRAGSGVAGSTGWECRR